MARVATEPGISAEELRLAARNHALPLEALRWPITPVGLHYLLVHYDIPQVDPASYRLRVDGLVERPLELTLAELQALPAVELAATMECAGNGRALLEPRPLSQPWLTEAVGTARWRGPRLSEVLARAEPAAGGVEAVFAGLDRGVEAEAEQRYERSLPLAEATGGEAILAYAMNGQPLPPQHGYPLRLLVPGWYGMTNVKWLGSITLVERPFEGYQQARAYRLRRDEEEPGAPLSRMAVRALMVPPGIPEFFTRERLVRLGTVELEGRAWSGWAPVTRVEVSTDGGETWAPAALAEDVDSPWAWRRWTYAWEASAPGAHLLCCRASDAAGNVQPLEPTWNLGGYANNAVQRVPATVVEAG